MGEIELDDGVLVLKRVHVTYHLTVEPDAPADKIERAFQAHPARCPVYRSIHPQIAVTTALEVGTVGQERHD